MSNADELLTDTRQALNDFKEATGGPLADLIDAGVVLAGRVDDLLGHMDSGGTPPADWPIGQRGSRR